MKLMVLFGFLLVCGLVFTEEYIEEPANDIDEDQAVEDIDNDVEEEINEDDEDDDDDENELEDPTKKRRRRKRKRLSRAKLLKRCRRWCRRGSYKCKRYCPRRLQRVRYGYIYGPYGYPHRRYRRNPYQRDEENDMDQFENSYELEE